MGTDEMKFKKGDVVIRTGPAFDGVIYGHKYTVSHMSDLYNLQLNDDPSYYDPSYFNLVVEPIPTPAADDIKSPSHYLIGNEVRPFIKSWKLGYNESNIIKYLLRSPYKGNELKDLNKALDCLQDHIKDVIAKEAN